MRHRHLPKLMAKPRQQGGKWVCFLDIKTVSEANRISFSPFPRMARFRKHKQAVQMAWVTAPPMQPPYTVRLTRLSAGTLDGDNLSSALKAVRDQVAKQLGVDDRDSPDLRWVYAQEKAKRGVYRVICEVAYGG